MMLAGACVLLHCVGHVGAVRRSTILIYGDDFGFDVYSEIATDGIRWLLITITE